MDALVPAEKTIQQLTSKLVDKELFLEAYKQALEFALEQKTNVDKVDFLVFWNEGCWEEIQEHYPEFNLDSETHLHLIKSSGGMST